MNFSNKLKKENNISHCYFGKKGGVSKGIYKSLNCGLGSYDLKKNVIKNLKIVKKKIRCKNNNLVLLNQIHSNKIIKINKIPKVKFKGDGFFTNKKKIALGILTADCAPVLFYDKKRKVIGAAHVGWKGAYKNIVIKLINAIVKDGSKKKDLIVSIGPCISQKNYEVKRDFYNKFLKKDKNNKIFFIITKKNIYFHLSRYIKYQLISAGVNQIDTINKDTYLKKNSFFSSRYCLKNNMYDYGRNISIIMIK